MRSLILDELQWRGAVAQTTDEAALREALAAGPITLYCGFDPTAPSLHFGNFVQLVALASEFPGMGTTYKYGTRRFYPRKFPFSVVYLERADEIYVLALAPFARKPGYWRTRRTGG